jgi:hypothetical protein
MNARLELTIRAAALCLAASALASPLAAETPEARGDRAFLRRADGFAEHGAPDPRPIDAAVAAYEEAVRSDPDNLRLIFKLLDALYFKGYHVVAGEAAKREIYQRLVDLTTHALDLVAAATGRADELDELPLERQAELERAVPGAARAHYWAIASWGLWGMTHHPLRALSKGVGWKVRDHARMLILIDERFGDAAGLRMLGRFHTEAPKVPLITGWVDRRRGLEMLRRAVEISRHDPRNLLFLAEAILEHEPEHRAEAVALLRELAARVPDPAQRVEHSESLELARALLANLERDD